MNRSPLKNAHILRGKQVRLHLQARGKGNGSSLVWASTNQLRLQMFATPTTNISIECCP
jgi:hypothetical protein